MTTGPYKEEATNQIYNLLFCDDLELFRPNTETPYSYPFDSLFSTAVIDTALQTIINDQNTDPRIKLLAYKKLMGAGQQPSKKELLAVIVEVSMDTGLDVLASFQNGTARYINHSAKILAWETTTDKQANELTYDLFAISEQIIPLIGPWDQPRRPAPATGNTRISFLVSDGLYFGEGPTDVLFNDPMAGPALASATHLMQYLTEKSLK